MGDVSPILVQIRANRVRPGDIIDLGELPRIGAAVTLDGRYLDTENPEKNDEFLEYLPDGAYFDEHEITALSDWVGDHLFAKSKVDFVAIVAAKTMGEVSCGAETSNLVNSTDPLDFEISMVGEKDVFGLDDMKPVVPHALKKLADAEKIVKGVLSVHFVTLWGYRAGYDSFTQEFDESWWFEKVLDLEALLQ